MLKNKPIYIFAIILIAVLVIAISVVVSEYNKNKPIVPNTGVEVLSSNDMAKVKMAYEAQGKKQEFLNVCHNLELAVANKLLDGTVTNDEQLATAIDKINKVIATDDWSYLGVEAATYWMGTWNLDTKGTVTFTFQNENMKPDWSKDEDVVKYIK